MQQGPTSNARSRPTTRFHINRLSSSKQVLLLLVRYCNFTLAIGGISHRQLLGLIRTPGVRTSTLEYTAPVIDGALVLSRPCRELIFIDVTQSLVLPLRRHLASSWSPAVEEVWPCHFGILAEARRASGRWAPCIPSGRAGRLVSLNGSGTCHDHGSETRSRFGLWLQ